MSEINPGESLKRVVGVPGLAVSVVNISIGAGIFALPALVGIQLGAASVFGYLFCGLMFAAIILCYVEIGSRIKSSGGSYAYVETAFGPYAGFIVNWLFFFGWGVIGDAAIMNIVVDSLAFIFPEFKNTVPRFLILALLVGFMALINIRDTKQSISFLKLITLVKLIPLIAIIIFGFKYIDTENLRIEHFPPVDSLGKAVLILFFAFAGFETTLNISGEIKNPKRTVPLGILIGGLIVFTIYLLLQTITQGVLGSDIVVYKEAPLAAVADKIIGAAGFTILLIAAAVSGFGTVHGDVLASSRLLFAGARNGLFPKFLGRIHKKFETPFAAIFTYSFLIFSFSVSGGFKELAILASGALLLIYLAVIIALIKLRRSDFSPPEGSFRIPGGMSIPVIAIAAILYVLSNLSSKEAISIAIFIAAISLVYLIMTRFKLRETK